MRADWRKVWSLLTLALIARAGCAEGPAGGAAAVPHYEGSVRTEYDIRSQGDQKDSDLYETWYGGARDLMRGCLDIYVSGRSHQDLDYTSSATLADDMFRGPDDSATQDRLLQAYADAHDRSDTVRVKAGRQYIDSADFLHLDGAQASLFEKQWMGVGGYYGNPVSYYSSLSGDHAGGVWLTGRPWTGNRSKVTYARYDDHDGEHDQNYYLESQQEVTESARLSGSLSYLNDSFRMARGDLYYLVPDGETAFYGGASRWGSFDARTRAYSPLYDVLGDQAPATYAYAKVSQQVWKYFMVTPGVSSRFSEGDRHDYANRNYNDYDLTLTCEPNKKISASVAVDYWDLSDGDSFLGLSGEVRYRRAKLWEVAVGSSYANYTYNSFSDISYTLNGGQTMFSQDGTISVENPSSYTYFVRMKWALTRRLILRLQGDIEDDSTSSDLGYWARASIEVKL